MNKLLHAGFKRLFTNKLLLICCAVMFGLGVFLMTAIHNLSSPDRVLFIYLLPASLLIAAVASMFVGTEYSDGTLRNKIIVGHKRGCIYLSNLIMSVTAGVLLCAAYAVPSAAAGLIRFGGFDMSTPTMLGLVGISIAAIAALAAINNMIAMLSKNKAATAVICLLLFIVLLIIASYFNSALDEPEFENGIIVTTDGGFELGDPQPNPKYIGGMKREIYQFIYDFNPAGQAMMFTDLSMVHFWQLAVYSIIIVITTTVIGMCIFKRKDLA